MTSNVRIHPDVNDYRVDEAGYAIATKDTLVSAATSIASLGHCLDGLAPSEVAELLKDDDTVVESLRSRYADRLRRLMGILSGVADQLEGEQVDERNSGRVGWDAKHSVFELPPPLSRQAHDHVHPTPHAHHRKPDTHRARRRFR